MNKIIRMKQVISFFLLYFITAFIFNANAQQVVPIKDSLATAFSIKNKKVIQITPYNPNLTVATQKNTSELFFILDDFFDTGKHLKDKTIKAKEYLTKVNISRGGKIVDSILSVVYILEISDAVFYKKQLNNGIFLKANAKPSKMPEQFFISSLKNGRASAQRQSNIKVYLKWLFEKYS